MTSLVGAWTLLTFALAAAPAPAAAESVSSAELAQLAGAAVEDPAALQRLRGVDEVDGRPADLGAALAGADGSELETRLRAIVATVAGEPGGGGDADARRSDAERIIGELPPPEKASSEPDRAPLELSDGGGIDIGPLGLIAAAIALAGGGLLAYRLIRGRERSYSEQATSGASEPEATPDELARRAGEAERAGDYAAAVRLRLRWALAALGRSGAIELRSSLTPAGAARQLGDPRASELVGTFERVVYGRKQAGAADAEAAREGWPRVIEAAARNR